MTLEQELKQEKFHSEFEKMAVNLMFTSGWLYNINASRLKPFDVTPEQYNVLRILRGSYPKTIKLSDITNRMINKNSNATRLVEKLRRKYLVKREICESNRRQVDIVITDKGLSLLRQIDDHEQQWLSHLKSISRSDAAELNRILDKLRSI